MLVAGVDEVGRGPLAGSVMAAAVILNPEYPIVGLADSKLLTSRKRDILYEIIKENCVTWAIGCATVEEIDRINILQASLLAMQRAVDALNIKPNLVQVDGQFIPKVNYPAEAIVGGDKLIAAISAASIMAKVVRDREMLEYDSLYPEYGFARHKGYGTTQHLLALKRFGVTPIHRCSFAPVRNVIKMAEKNQ